MTMVHCWHGSAVRAGVLVDPEQGVGPDSLADEGVASHLDELVAWMRATVPAGATVADLGCGTGNHALALAASGVRGFGTEVDVNEPDYATTRAFAKARSGRSTSRQLMPPRPADDP